MPEPVVAALMNKYEQLVAAMVRIGTEDLFDFFLGITLCPDVFPLSLVLEGPAGGSIPLDQLIDLFLAWVSGCHLSSPV